MPAEAMPQRRLSGGPAVPSSCTACEGSHLGRRAVSAQRITCLQDLRGDLRDGRDRRGGPEQAVNAHRRGGSCMDTAGSGDRGSQRFVVTEAEREVADLLPLEVSPELARATVQAVPFWFHTFALNRPTVLTRRVPRAITAIAWRWCRPILPGCACSTSVRLMASTRSSPSAAGPSGWWRRQRAVPAVGRCPLGNRAGWQGGLSRDPSAAGRGGRACGRG